MDMEIPCKLYRAKLNFSKDGEDTNSTITTATTNLNAQTGLANGDNGVAQTATRAPLFRTQIAKISCSPEAPQKHTERASTSVKNVSTTRSGMYEENVQNNDAIKNQILEFNRQKIERTQEMQRINEMLEEISKSPVILSARTIENEHSVTSTYHSHIHEEAPEISTNIIPTIAPADKHEPGKSKTDRPTYNRSKSDMHFVTSRTSVTNRECARVNAPNTTMHARSQSSYALPTTSDRKEKFYDRADTRRFMEEQRKKRRINTTINSEANKTAKEKEEIKKRLEELRKNTRKIINKNMQKRQRGGLAPKVRKEPANNDNISGKLIFRQPTPRVSKISECSEKTENVEKTDNVEPINNNENNSKAPLLENKKRIGLLRKPETNDHSYSAINDIVLNKENVAMDIMTPKFAAALESHMTSQCQKSVAKEEEKQATTKAAVEARSIYEDNGNLKIPNMTLKSNVVVDSEATSARLNADIADAEDKSHRWQQVQSEMPYWLKPSAVQIYPYNFICAVRRKLESITNQHTCVPVASATPVVAETKKVNQTTSTGGLFEDIFDKSVNVAKAHKVKSNRKISSSCSSAIFSQDKEGESSQSDQMTNYSSISIHLPDSEVTSLTSELHLSSKSGKARIVPAQEEVLGESQTSIHSKHFANVPEKSKPLDTVVDDDTTVSSAILNSVEVASTHFKRNEPVEENQHEFIVPQRVSSPLDLKKVQTLKVLPKSERKTHGGSSARSAPIDFDKFLIDFNHSLSQVIKVNEKLKNTIEKSPSSYRSESKKSDTKKYSAKSSLKEEYTTDDFEESSHSRESLRPPISEESRINTASYTKTSLAELRSQKVLVLQQKLSEVMTERSHRSNPVSQTIATEVQNKSLSSDVSINEIATEPASNETRIISTHFHEVTFPTTTTGESIKEELRNEHELSHYENENAMKAKRRKSHIRTHINERRGDFLLPTADENKKELVHFKPSIHSKEMMLQEEGEGDDESLKLLPSSSASSLGKEIATAFKHNDLESVSLSESSFNYSTIGQYEKLIQQETTKSEQLTILMKMREKSLIDRTKGQIAWLELQKERYKSKGLLVQIAAIKKKQRAILLKMEKEREEIKRLLQANTSSSALSTHSSSHKQNRRDNAPVGYELTAPAELLLNQKTSITTLSSHSSRKVSKSRKLRHEKDSLQNNNNNHNTNNNSNKNRGIVRAIYELETTRSLEDLLHKREADLGRRREHVERLMEWHRRLDQEEAEVKQLENMLLKYNNEHSQYQNHEEINKLEATTPTTTSTKTTTTKNSSPAVENINRNNNNKCSERSNKSSTNQEVKNHTQQLNRCLNYRTSKMERRLKEIDHSLRELGSISGAHSSSHSHSQADQQLSGTGSSESVGNLINVDFVRTNGSKLNKLWRRLTSQQVERFEPQRRYKLCKADLERLYEDAKLAVLNDFTQNKECLAGELLGSSTIASVSSLQQTEQVNEVPPLNLSFCQSTERSADEQSDRENLKHEDQEELEESVQGNYHPSMAEEYFNLSNHSNRSTESELNNPPYTSTERQRIIEENVEKFVMLTSQLLVNHGDLKRSSSDTEILTAKSTSSPMSMTSGSIETAAPTLNSVHNVFFETMEESGNAELVQIDSKTSFEDQKSTASVQSDEAVIIEKQEEEEPQQIEELPDSYETIETVENKSREISNSNELVEHLSESPKSTNNDNIENNSNSRISHEITEEVPSPYTFGSTYSMQFEEEVTEAERVTENDENTLIAESSIAGEEDVEMISSENITKTSAQEDVEKTDGYSANFELSLDETQIDDISTPHFETTFETTRDESDNEIGKSMDANEHIEAVKTMSQLPPPPPPPPPLHSTTVLNASSTSSAAAGQLMPDIINELEIRRCQQIFIENEHLKQYEHVTAVPYVYVREIPNKPPPPYVPPDHGSPMTTIFPSEERIKDITYRSTHELYCKLLKTEYINEHGEKLPSVHDEKITNIYERIILDICREFLEEHHEVLKQGDPDNFHSQLAFFNPPDRLRCLQESIYREVRRCLAMNKTSPKRSQVYSVYGQRAKRDHIGKIITQELYDEDDKWCNFRHEEREVLELIVEEMLAKYLSQIATDVLLEEGGEVESSSEQTPTVLKENLLSPSIAEATAPTEDTKPPT